VALDVETGEEREFEADECGFAYRASIFNFECTAANNVILRVTYALSHDGAPRGRVRGFEEYFRVLGPQATLAETREAVRLIRAGKSMLLTPGDEDARSVGSFFKNPVLSPEQLTTSTSGQPPEYRGANLPAGGSARFTIASACLRESPTLAVLEALRES